jgi:5-deoxy-glucuronate isomerase
MVKSENLLVKARAVQDGFGEMISFTPEAVGWEHLGFSARKMRRGESFSATTGKTEVGIVLMGGRCSVESSEGSWRNFGRRTNVFDGVAYTLYLPVQTSYTVTAETDCEIAVCSTPAERRFPARLITPQEVSVETRGGGNATRQVNGLLMPDAPADRLILVEVYTPSGNWSSFPPHKHQVHNPPREVDLEEIYYYKIDRPEGYAIQRVYSHDGERDATVTVHDGELMLIPDGYHPVVAAHGYNVYYLNALSGSARSLAATLDPDFSWVTSTWAQTDPRVPVVREPIEARS